MRYSFVAKSFLIRGVNPTEARNSASYPFSFLGGHNDLLS
jgi:hypothetical protein